MWCRRSASNRQASNFKLDRSANSHHSGKFHLYISAALFFLVSLLATYHVRLAARQIGQPHFSLDQA